MFNAVTGAGTDDVEGGKRQHQRSAGDAVHGDRSSVRTRGAYVHDHLIERREVVVGEQQLRRSGGKRRRHRQRVERRRTHDRDPDRELAGGDGIGE